MALVKAESRTGDQDRDFPGPFKASVRGARMRAALREKLSVEVSHPQKPLQSRLVRWRRKGGDGSGMLGQWQTTVGGEQVSKKLDLGHSKFALGEANGQPMLTTEEKNFMEMIYVGGEILAED